MLLGIGDLCFEFEYAYWMAKDEQPGAANVQVTTEFSANACIADIPADSMERLSVRNKINVKAGFLPATSIFEFADTIHVAHSFGFLPVLEAIRTCPQNKSSCLSAVNPQDFNLTPRAALCGQSKSWRQVSLADLLKSSNEGNARPNVLILR